MSPFAEYLIRLLRELVLATGCPARTVILADMLNLSPRAARWHLKRLEAAGVVKRRGARGGWLPATMAG